MIGKVRIWLFGYGSVSEWTAVLKAQIATEAGEGFLIEEQHLPLSGVGVAAALETAIRAARPDLVVFLVGPEGNPELEGLLTTAQQHPAAPPFVVVASASDPRLIHRWFELGASDFLVPPLRAFEVWPRLRRLVRFPELANADVAELKQSVGLQQLIGESPLLLEQIRKIPVLARCHATVLITGETGTGKELCARAVHYLGPRAGQPCVALNCGAIPVELMENELFGHESGAFTGAHSAQPGVIREADGGTLFLDEIDSLPLAAQVKLLRFLQDREFRPLGARKPCRADVRIIAAANTKLDEAVKANRFREDLYYRLNVLRLELPPLRKRLADIPLLARHFLARYAAEFNQPANDFAPAALRKLALHDWPGNVRELENVIERAVALSSGRVLQAADLDVPVPEEAAARSESFRQLKARVVAEFERGYVTTLLEQHHGNIARAAGTAQKNRRAFFQLMRKHRIRVRLTSGAPAPQVDKSVIEMDRNVHPPGGGAAATESLRPQ